MDLLEHEVRVAALLRGLGGPQDRVDDPLERRAVAVGEHRGSRPQIGNVAVLHEHDLLGVRHDRGRVRGQERLALADAHDQRRIEPRADQSLGLVAVHDHQRVRALEAAEGGADRIGEVALICVLHEMGNDFRVRLRVQGVAASDQLGAKLSEVLHDAVVDDRDAAGAIGVGVSVQVARPAVRSPASVAQAHSGAGRLAPQRVLQDRHLARALLNEEVTGVGDKSDAGGVVAPVFEPPESVEQDGPGLSRPRVSNDSAHMSISRSSDHAPGEGG